MKGCPKAGERLAEGRRKVGLFYEMGGLVENLTIGGYIHGSGGRDGRMARECRMRRKDGRPLGDAGKWGQ